LLSGSGTPEARPQAPASSVDGSVASRVIMEADQIARACARMAHQILEANRGAHDLVLMGIPTRGVPLAHRLAQVMDEVEGVRVPVGALDVTMYRDDLRRQPTRAVGHTDLPVDVEGSTVVLVDDVLYSGRTVRAALDALGDLRLVDLAGREQRHAVGRVDLADARLGERGGADVQQDHGDDDPQDGASG